jgi:hypothetical protein
VGWRPAWGVRHCVALRRPRRRLPLMGTSRWACIQGWDWALG